MGWLDRILRRFRADDEPPASAPGLFTARSPGVPTERGDTGPTAPPEDLWDRPGPSPDAGAPRTAGPDVAEPVDPEAELAAIEELAPPAEEPETPVEPIWDEEAWAEADPTAELSQHVADHPTPAAPAGEAGDGASEDGPVAEAVAPAGSTAEEPLFSAYEAAPEPPAPDPAEPDPVPALFDPPEVAIEPAPEDLMPEAASVLEPGHGAEPEPEAAPRELVVETHPEVFDDVPEPGPATADVPGSVADVAGTGGDPAIAGDDRTMRVHDERLDKRPGPIRMTPSEAIRLAQDGPRGARRRDHPEA